MADEMSAEKAAWSPCQYPSHQGYGGDEEACIHCNLDLSPSDRPQQAATGHTRIRTVYGPEWVCAQCSRAVNGYVEWPCVDSLIEKGEQNVR